MPRTQLTSDLDLYVAPAGQGGSDSNSGTLAQPLATGNEAVKRICNGYDPNGWQMNVRLLPHATAKHAPIQLRNYMECGVQAQHTNARIVGDPANPHLHHIQAASPHPATILGVDVHTTWLIEGVKVSHTGGGFGIEADRRTLIYLKAVEFGACGVGVCSLFESNIHFLNYPGYPLYTISGTMSAFLMANMKSQIMLHAGSFGSAVGNPSVTHAFAQIEHKSHLYNGSPVIGTIAVNKKYVCEYGSGIEGVPHLPNGNLPSAPGLYSYAQ